MPVILDQPFQILLELIQTHKLDPWDVDIQKLTDVFLQRVREMRELDLRLSGRTLLSASILLRMKSEAMLDDGRARPAGEELEESLDLDLPELGPIEMIQRSPRKITLEELLGVLYDALSEEPVYRRPPRRKIEKVVRALSEYHINIEKHLDELYEKIKKLAAPGRLVTFSELLTDRSKIFVVRTLLLILFLSMQGKISLRQDETFGEIFISPLQSPGV
jgi:segregation and condensation protein A